MAAGWHRGKLISSPFTVFPPIEFPPKVGRYWGEAEYLISPPYAPIFTHCLLGTTVWNKHEVTTSPTTFPDDSLPVGCRNRKGECGTA